MKNRIRFTRLERDYCDLRKLETECATLFSIDAMRGNPPDTYVLYYNLTTLVKTSTGIEQHTGVRAVLYCPVDYPIDGVKVLIQSPENIFHPNIRYPHVCLSRWVPSQSLCEVVRRLAMLVTYQSYTMVEQESLDREACAFARRRQDTLPVDHRQLVRNNGMRIEVW